MCVVFHRYLISQGANVGGVNSEGETPLDIAEEEAMEELLQNEINRQGRDICSSTVQSVPDSWATFLSRYTLNNSTLQYSIMGWSHWHCVASNALPRKPLFSCCSVCLLVALLCSNTTWFSRSFWVPVNIYNLSAHEMQSHCSLLLDKAAS